MSLSEPRVDGGALGRVGRRVVLRDHQRGHVQPRPADVVLDLGHQLVGRVGRQAASHVELQAGEAFLAGELDVGLRVARQDAELRLPVARPAGLRWAAGGGLPSKVASKSRRRREAFIVCGWCEV